LGAALLVVKGFAAAETGHAYARARELWEQLGSPSEFLHIPWGQTNYHTIGGRFDQAQIVAEDLLRVGHQRNDTAGLVLGHLSSGRNLMYMGSFALSRSHLEEGLRLYDPISHRSLVHQAGTHPHVNVQPFLGIVLFCLGFPDQALAESNAAIAEARRLAHPASLAGSVALVAILLSLVGEVAVFEERTEEFVAVAAEQGFPYWIAAGTIFRGWVKIKNGDVTEGISLLRNGIAAFRATGGEAWTPYMLALLAAACEIAAQVEEAVKLLDDALQIVEEKGGYWFSAELNRHKGRLLLRQGYSEAAEEMYCKALTIARAQEAKLWELRGAVSLARLHYDQGRHTEARDLLAPVYGWFTEGFGTADLREAKALLNEIGDA
jgi:predicted ATPase